MGLVRTENFATQQQCLTNYRMFQRHFLLRLNLTIVDSSELTSWSSISDLDTVSLLTSISSLSFGEIISVSGEDEGELTADEIDDEVWDDYVNEGKGGSIN